MAHLYKFTCKPNFPVVREATLVIYSFVTLTNLSETLADYASKQGFINAKQGNCTASYLGYFEPNGVAEMYPEGILVCISGEY